MRSLLRRCALVAAMTIFCASSGCDGITLGPRVKTEYVVIHSGRPLQILQNKKITGRVLDGSGAAVDQDIGGWVAMPMEHWEALVRSLPVQQSVPEGKPATKSTVIASGEHRNPN